MTAAMKKAATTKRAASAGGKAAGRTRSKTPTAKRPVGRPSKKALELEGAKSLKSNPLVTKKESLPKEKKVASPNSGRCCLPRVFDVALNLLVPAALAVQAHEWELDAPMGLALGLLFCSCVVQACKLIPQIPRAWNKVVPHRLQGAWQQGCADDRCCLPALSQYGACAGVWGAYVLHRAEHETYLVDLKYLTEHFPLTTELLDHLTENRVAALIYAGWGVLGAAFLGAKLSNKYSASGTKKSAILACLKLLCIYAAVYGAAFLFMRAERELEWGAQAVDAPHEISNEY